MRPKQDCVCHTFGDLFRDLAYQLERGEYDSLGHRLRQCGDDWFDIPLPDDGQDE